MASLREIRRKIKSVKSTEQITKAMKMVAAARMRRSQSAILSSRPFAVRLEELVRRLALLEIAADIAAGREIQIHSFFDQRESNKIGLLLVTADKGLCGAFNSNLLRATLDFLRAHKGQEIKIVVVGRKGREFLHRLKGFEFKLISELGGIFPKVNFAHAELVGKALIDAYEKDGLSKIHVIYNEFKSVAQQKLIQTTLLPIPPVAGDPEKVDAGEYGFEPDRQELLASLLPRYIKAQLYRILLESQAAELAARMNAMDAASKNAKELRESLNLNLNRRRQAIITNEIAELVGGAEALAA
jgi:F-type H+-transporting ATPase subunit gamma